VKTHTVKGAAGTDLHVREWGDPGDPPILLIHGWSQSHLCWAKQYDSGLQNEFRLVALDLRGHGMSDAPLDPAEYTDSGKWADDIAAVICQLGLLKPTLVGWSYAGFVISDYLSKYGSSDIAGINFVAAAVVLGPKAFGPLIGPGFLQHAPGACDPDLATNIAAIRSFVRACTAAPLEHAEFELALAYNMVVPAKVRAFLIRREIDAGPVLENLRIPVLVTHGRADTVVLAAMSEYILQHCPTAGPSWFEAVGHAPFLEEPARFNRELAAFARKAAD